MQCRFLTNLLRILSGVLATMLIGYAGSETPSEKKSKQNFGSLKNSSPTR